MCGVWLFSDYRKAGDFHYMCLSLKGNLEQVQFVFKLIQQLMTYHYLSIGSMSGPLDSPSSQLVFVK